jgi:hypothetical protein
MECLRAAITHTREDAYAHHIQRLMVTGNFALLLGVLPQAVHEWYLTVYADAYEWVELLNTLGMSQFSDGGVLGKAVDTYGRLSIERAYALCKLINSGEKGRVLRLRHIVHRLEKRPFHIPVIDLGPDHERVDIIKDSGEASDNPFAFMRAEAVVDLRMCQGQHIWSLLVFFRLLVD